MARFRISQTPEVDEGSADYCLRIPSAHSSEVMRLLTETAYGEVSVRGLAPGDRCIGLFENAASALAAIRQAGLSRVAVPQLLSAKDATVARALHPVFFGPPIGLEGNFQIGPNEIVRAVGRDVLIVFYQDTFEGEPFVGTVWVFDGDSDRQIVTGAWDFVLDSTEQNLVYQATYVVLNRESDPTPVDYRADVAAAMGVTIEYVDATAFADGFAGNHYIVRPAVLDLSTGRERLLPFLGGGVWRRIGNDVVGLVRPAYWELSEWSDTPNWYRLDLAASSWSPTTPPPEPLLDEASAEDWNQDARVGDVLVATRDGSMGLVVVDVEMAVQAARLVTVVPGDTSQ